MGIPDHVTCLLRNMYAGQKATVRNRHGKKQTNNKKKQTNTGSTLGKEYNKAVYCHSDYLTHMQSQFSCSVMSNSLQPHGLQHTRLPCPSPTPRACSNSCPWSQWCHCQLQTGTYQGHCQWLNNKGICHLPLWRMNPMLPWLLTSTIPEGIPGGVRHSVLQGIWWDKSIDTWMFLGTDFVISILASPHI